VQQAEWVQNFVDGRDLVAETVIISGVAETVSQRERWLLDVEGEIVKVDASELQHADARRVSVGDLVTLRIRLAQRQQPDGTLRITRQALELVDVVPEEDPPSPVGE
jgi:hypothetical protein